MDNVFNQSYALLCIEDPFTEGKQLNYFPLRKLNLGNKTRKDTNRVISDMGYVGTRCKIKVPEIKYQHSEFFGFGYKCGVSIW